MQPKLKLMLDSGAFSSFTQGLPVDLVAYTNFCLSNSKHVAHVVNLDVIKPGNPEVAASEGRQNFLYMKEKGVEVLPVYHARERLKWFDLMLNDSKYIGISATSLVSTVESLGFLDLAWHYGTDSQGYPLAKYHAFGDTAPYSLLTYPWYSADSATWMIQAGRAGSIKLNGTSFRLRSKKVQDTNYISEDMVGPQKESWERECKALGLKPDKVLSVQTTASQLAMIRSYMVASDILKLQERAEPVDRFKKPQSLIATKKSNASPGYRRVGPPNMYFVISPSAFYFNFPVVLALGIKHILVSYFYVSREKEKFWNEHLVPFLYDPYEFCQTHPKTKVFWDKLQECLLHPYEKPQLVGA
jgi:hypothetical protein